MEQKNIWMGLNHMGFLNGIEKHMEYVVNILNSNLIYNYE